MIIDSLLFMMLKSIPYEATSVMIKICLIAHLFGTRTFSNHSLRSHVLLFLGLVDYFLSQNFTDSFVLPVVLK